MPSDWGIEKIKRLVSITTGGKNTQDKVEDGQYPFFVRSQNVERINSYSFDGEAVLTAGDGVGTGKVFHYINGKFDLHQRVYKISNFDVRLNGYFFFLYFSNNFYNRIMQMTAKSSVDSVRMEMIADMFIPVPPIEEQTAIATALSDADALITALEKLIAKKRAIKQGVMQKLLQPKEGWEVKTIFELADKRKELFDDGDWIESEHIADEGIRLVQTGNIGVGIFIDDNKKYIFPESFQKLKCKEINEGDLLICRLADPAGRACILPYIKEKQIITSVDVTIFRPREEMADRRFLTYIFSTEDWFKHISERSGGTTHKRIARGALGKINISIPDIKEQKRIADILSDIDGEINALEIKLLKQRQLKQGMMQNLLTGKIRLV